MDALDGQQAATLRELGTIRRYARGAALFHERQPFDRALVLLSGRVKVCSTTDDGREVVLAVRDAGELLGEMSAIDGEPRSATAVALEPVEVLAVPASSFLTFLERNPKVALLLMRSLVRRLREADGMRVEFAAQDTVGRVAARLVDLAQRYGQEHSSVIRIDLPLSQEELASWTGCSREAVTKALHAMRELGWIETGRRTVTVLQLDALRRRGAG
jgi:CRP/FNR family transcriptional regulator, cyclic AMP receptor protein